jgi:Tfp pilus assembly protein PilX
MPGLTWRIDSWRRFGLPLFAFQAFFLASFAPLAFSPAKAAIPYAQAVIESRKAAQAVLDHAGSETCLRGKLTKVLLRLSASCEAAAQHNALCKLADKAVVVTPMSLTFMEETAHQLIDLTASEQNVSLIKP